MSTADTRRDFTERNARVENERAPHYASSELTTQLFIDGNWCAASGANTLPVFNPARPDEWSVAPQMRRLMMSTAPVRLLGLRERRRRQQRLSGMTCSPICPRL